ncbi:MAG TPA: hypothetical protein VFF65_10375, partial [Phycisphaerales bacterium]|nr:hypothetical protein [Phycisphaerales bacterium]
MHDPHDDPLERELRGLSSYSGAPAEPPLWQQAIDRHRAQQHQRLWVWVRRPAPALAAAALALLVTTIALQPGPNLRGRVVPTSELSAAAERSLRGGATAGAEPTPRSDSADPTGRLDRLHVTGDRMAPPSRSVVPTNPLSDLPPAAPPPSPPAPGPTNQPATTRSAGALSKEAGHTSPGNGGGSSGPVDAARSLDSTAPGDRSTSAGAGPPPGAAEPAPAAAAPANALESNDAAGAQLPLGAQARFNNAPYEVATNIRLGVNDFNRFYEVIPKLVDVKSGETYSDGQMPADVPANVQQNDVRSYTLRVKEKRVPEVIEELRKTGNLQVESAQNPPREERLKKIESAVIQQETEVKLAQAENKGKIDKSAKEHRQEKSELKDEAVAAQQRLSMLNSQRARIEQGADFAYINIQAVPEQQVAAVPAPPPPPPPPLAPPAPPGALGVGRPAGGAAPVLPAAKAPV